MSHANLTFKEIVNNYRKESQCKVGVFRSVFVGFSSANGNAVICSDLASSVIYFQLAIN